MSCFVLCTPRPPPRQSVADFLQEVTNRRDQEQYWTGNNSSSSSSSYRYVPVSEFAAAFAASALGQQAAREVAGGYDRSKEEVDALVYKKYAVSMDLMLEGNGTAGIWWGVKIVCTKDCVKVGVLGVGRGGAEVLGPIRVVCYNVSSSR